MNRDGLLRFRVDRRNREGITPCVIGILNAKACSQNGFDRHVLEQQFLKFLDAAKRKYEKSKKK